MARHVEWMKLIVEDQIQRQIQASDLLSVAGAKARFTGMLESGRTRFG